LIADRDEIALTSFLEILETGPVFNSLLLAKYIPNDLNSDDEIIYSWKRIGEGTEDWLNFAEGIQDEYTTTLYAMSGASISMVVGICALNAYGLAVIASAVAGSSVFALGLVKEAQSQKMLKFVLLTVGWHAPTILYITYQVLVLTTILSKLLAVKKKSDRKMAQYKIKNDENEKNLNSLSSYINVQNLNINNLYQTLSHNYTVALVDGKEPSRYLSQNSETLQSMSDELEKEIQEHQRLKNEVERYKISRLEYETQSNFLMARYADLRRNIGELTLCQKCVGTMSVVSIMSEVTYTLFYTVEKMDGEWNYLNHQFGNLYAHTASHKMNSSGAVHLLSPFDSAFQETVRCINQQLIHFFCANSVDSAYISDIFTNTSSALLALVYFLKGPMHSALEIIRFIRSHFDMYYSKDQIKKILDNTVNIAEFDAAQQVLNDKCKSRKLKMENIQTQNSFFTMYGMIPVDGVYPIIPLETTYLIDTSFKKQMEFKNVSDKLKKMKGIMQGSDENRSIES
jgi:hypothetical protein